MALNTRIRIAAAGLAVTVAAALYWILFWSTVNRITVVNMTGEDLHHLRIALGERYGEIDSLPSGQTAVVTFRGGASGAYAVSDSDGTRRRDMGVCCYSAGMIMSTERWTIRIASRTVDDSSCQ